MIRGNSRLLRTLASCGLAAAAALPCAALAYPLDGYQETGIRRLEGSRLANQGVVTDVKQPPGALLPMKDVDLRLVGQTFDLPPPDPEFTRQVDGILTGSMGDYGVAVLDLTDPARPRYAEHRADYKQNIGSVGKLLVVLSLFQALADTYPNDVEARKRVLKDTVVTADGFSQSDSHTVRIFDPKTRTLIRRPVQIGDRATLYEWLDWMLSPSSNSAGGMVMREAMLVRQYGTAYPPSEAEIKRFFDTTPKSDLTALFEKTFFEPVTRNGLDLEMLRQGSFFTATGKKIVPGAGDSYGTARELMRYLLRMEQGRIVDVWSSREIKRLIYVTERRIRYASSPALADAAVYFKSGSLFQCAPEPGFTCRPYAGNVKNYMNSTAIIESPAAEQEALLHEHAGHEHPAQELGRRASGAGDAPAAADRTDSRLALSRSRAGPPGGGSTGSCHSLPWNDQVVQRRGETREPFTAVAVMREADYHELVRAVLHQRAVGVEVLPGARLPIHLDARSALETLHELVPDARLRQRLLHQRAEFRADQPIVVEQPVEARDLERGGAMREVVQRVGLVGVFASVALAHPETAVALRIVKRDRRRLKDFEQALPAHPVENARSGLVAREADHLRDLGQMRGVEREAPAPGLEECAEQDCDLRQARRVDHRVTVQHREPGRVGARDVDEREREVARLDLGSQAELAHDTF